MNVRCVQCGKSFGAKNRTAKYCSQACRDRAYKARKSGSGARVSADPVKPRLSVIDGDGARIVDPNSHHKKPVADDVKPSDVPSVLVTARLRLADVPDADWRKAVALTMARRLDNGGNDTATAIANLADSLQKLMDEIAPADGEGDFLSEIGERAAKKRRRR